MEFARYEEIPAHLAQKVARAGGGGAGARVSAVRARAPHGVPRAAR